MQKAVDLQSFVDTVTGNEPWVGGRDVYNNDTMYWVGSGEHLPDSSPYWGGGEPKHSGTKNCVTVWADNSFLGIYAYHCDTWETKYICEKY